MQRGTGRKMHGESGKEMVWESVEEQSELIKEISSLRRERNGLLDSLTPSLSHWKQIHGEDEFQATAQTGRKEEEEEEETMPRKHTSSASCEHQHPLKKELADLLDGLLEDMENSGQRMLSTAYVVDKSSAPLPSYKSKEILSTTSKLFHISKEFYNKAMDMEMMHMDMGMQMEREMEMGEAERERDDFLSLIRNYLQVPDKYENKLALKFTGDEEEKEKEKEEKEKEKEEENKWKHKTEKEKDPSTVEFLKRRMAFHEEYFALHRESWEQVWGSNLGRHGHFEQTTTLSSMRFTHCAFPSPDTHGSTLEICSIKLIILKGLNWPLQVYGVVAARDTIDHNRNIIFSRLERNYQELNEKHPYLHLTGPSRAILAGDAVDFEVDLKINRGAESISLHKTYYAKGSTCLKFCSPNSNCMVELSVHRLATPVEATIVGVSVIKGKWPFQHGCRVVCEHVSDNLKPTVLLDYCGSEVSIESDGYLRLRRNVVSVGHGPLRIAIQAYSKSGGVAQQAYVDFPAQECQISVDKLLLGSCELKIVVAWSLVKGKVGFPAVEGSVPLP